jgi:uncharacterized oligopeptide transporter (OPT) family protein
VVLVKVTQLCFAIISPGDSTDNLMSANVTGGSARQCGDVLHAHETGYLVGAHPKHQATARLFGVLAGVSRGEHGVSHFDSESRHSVIAPEGHAPTTAQSKAVTEVFAEGVTHLPPGRGVAALIAGAVGVALTVAKRNASETRRKFLPSAASAGLAFVLPAYYSLSVVLGALLPRPRYSPCPPHISTLRDRHRSRTHCR